MRELGVRIQSWFPATRLPRFGPQQALRAAEWSCLALLLALVILLAVPTLLTFFGYRVYVVYGGSMGTSLPAGSIGITRTVDSQFLEVGDIVAIKKSGRAIPVLHRIVDIKTDGGATAYITQGDSNDSPDPEPVSLEGPGDRVLFAIPYLGYLVHFARGTLGRVLLLLMPSLLLSSFALWHIWRPTTQRVHVSEEPEC